MKAFKFKFVIALALGLLGAMTTWLYSEHQDDEHEALVANNVEVVKALRNLPAGTPLTRDLIDTESVARKFLPPNPLMESELNIYLGTPLSVNIEEGSMILTSDFDDDAARKRELAALASPLVIKTAELVLEADGPAKAGRDALAAVSAAGGYIVESDILVTRDDERFSMVARVPAAEFESFVFALDEIGVPISRRIRGAGVQSDIERLEARIGNQAFKVEGLRHADPQVSTKTRTETTHVLRGEQHEQRLVETTEVTTGHSTTEITRANEELSALEGELRSLKERTALSTVELSIQKTRPDLEEIASPQPTLGEQLTTEFTTSTRIVVSTFFGALRAAIAALPFLLALAPFVLGVGIWTRRRRQTSENR